MISASASVRSAARGRSWSCAVAAVTVLTPGLIAAARGTDRPLALGCASLRLLALLLCLLAALRPSVLFKQKETASRLVAVLVDASTQHAAR